MSHDVFSVGEIAITQGHSRVECNGLEVTVLGPLEFIPTRSMFSGCIYAATWRYPVRWPDVSEAVYVRYYQLRKRRPPSDELIDAECWETQA